MSATEQQTAPQPQEQQQTTPQQVENQQQGQQQPTEQPKASEKYIITHSDMPTNPEAQADSTSPEPEKAANDQAGQNQEAAKPDGSADAGTKEGEKEPRWYVKKMDRMHKKIKQLEEKLDAQEKSGSASTAPATTGDGEPDIVDFESYDDYLKARDKWRDAKGKKESQKPEQYDPDKDEDFKSAYSEIAQSATVVETKYNDFKEVVSQDDLAISASMVKIIADVDDVEPADVVYYLGKHKAEALAIAQMDNERDQIKAIAKIEAKLSSKPGTPAPKTTKAPPPINPLSGANNTPPRKLSDAKSQQEYREIKRELEGGRPVRAGWL